jgi:hypothetical protein
MLYESRIGLRFSAAKAGCAGDVGAVVRTKASDANVACEGQVSGAKMHGSSGFESSVPTRSSSRDCYIHAGTHKTGTSSIQAFLALNRERFASHGVLIPRAACEPYDHLAAHHSIPRELCGSPMDAGSLAALSSELAQSDAAAACISSEDFSLLSRSPQALIAIRDAIHRAGFTPKIVMFLRPQVAYCVRVYAENVRHGFRTSLADYLNDVVRTGAYVWETNIGMPFDYTVLLDSFAAVFGTDAIIAQAYRVTAPNESLLRTFAGLVLPEPTALDGFELPPTRLNASPAFANVLKALSIDEDLDPALRFAPLGLAATTRLVAHFAPLNVRLRRKYGVTLSPCEPADVLQALPFRRTIARSRALRIARRRLRTFESTAHLHKDEALDLFEALQHLPVRQHRE